MKKWLMRLGTAAAVGFLALTVLNASWLAPQPKGAVKLVAHRGLAQLSDSEAAGFDSCTVTRIEEPIHDYLENSTRSIARAAKLGATLVEVDVMPTSDGQVALFQDATLDCRTDGTGATRGKTLAELKALDAGHGYTADGGKTYPFRGKGVGAIPSLEEALAVTGRARLLYRFTSDDPREAELLAAALKASGRNVGPRGDAFVGPSAPIERIRELLPDAWAYTVEEGEACTRAYVALGWSGYVPESCRGGTIFVPLDSQWAMWGWPNRMIARMEAHGTHIVVVRSSGENGPAGLDLPEQLGEIPNTFNGYAMVDDGFAVIPALIQRFDDRSQEEIDTVYRGLEARRLRRGD
ncbi:glycerophosphodiester phosphodiesterase family protein [Erythrobacter mangrovi]|uniref:Glycerophosphodiester phosphodiesterase n=1 Tax=Erythrobacter mangrovi TaxID=2739433 RepID=A0A7D3XHB2_9SPHN|nr:glycerophosphodiester phosphodiesterase family protein [Erythrobacter mangrovi]QKG70978.1 glycerophosphodiester phosphodiesterase [Erythrobacter mangrovi]